MESNQPKTPKKGAGSRLRDLSKKRREQSKPSKELLEILRTPSEQNQKEKKSALPKDNQDLEI